MPAKVSITILSFDNSTADERTGRLAYGIAPDNTSNLSRFSVMTASDHSRRFCHVCGMSGKGPLRTTGHQLLEFYSGAAEQSGRLTEGLLLRRLQPMRCLRSQAGSMLDAMSGYDEEKRYAVVAETRQKWTAAERKLIVAETEASWVSCVALTHGAATSIVYLWRREVA